MIPYHRWRPHIQYDTSTLLDSSMMRTRGDTGNNNINIECTRNCMIAVAFTSSLL